jgi:hypothetical protein
MSNMYVRRFWNHALICIKKEAVAFVSPNGGHGRPLQNDMLPIIASFYRLARALAIEKWLRFDWRRRICYNFRVAASLLCRNSAAFWGIVIRMFIKKITAFQIVGPYSLALRFEDGLERTVDFLPILAGELLGPLRDPSLFKQVRLDAESQTVVWPNGADFDPATLYDWPRFADAFAKQARRWELATA